MGRSIGQSASAVNVAAVAYAKDKDTHHAILNVSDYAVVTDPIFPEILQIRPFQSLSDGTRIFQLGQTTMQKSKNAPRILVAQFRKLALGITLKLNLPGHIAS